jgi:hypothetical protein
MSDNTAPKSVVGVPFQNGADPRRGHGKKGRSGRKPDWVKRMAERELPATIKFLRQVRDGQVLRKSYGANGKVMRYPDGTMIPTPERAEIRDAVRAAELLLKTAGVLTNKTELTGKDGGPVEMNLTETERERASRIALLLSRVNGN